MFAKSRLIDEIKQILSQKGVQYDDVRVSRGRLYVHVKSRAESYHVCELLSRLDGRFRPELASDTVVALRQVDDEGTLIPDSEIVKLIAPAFEQTEVTGFEAEEPDQLALPRLDLCLLFGALPPIAAGVYASSASSAARRRSGVEKSR